MKNIIGTGFLSLSFLVIGGHIGLAAGEDATTMHSAEVQLATRVYSPNPNLPLQNQLMALVEECRRDPKLSKNLKLDLRRTSVTDDHLAWIIQQFPSLKALNLRKQALITNETTLKSIAQLKELKWLDLSWTHIDEEAVKFLRNLDSKPFILADSIEFLTGSIEISDLCHDNQKNVLSFLQTPEYAPVNQKFKNFIKEQSSFCTLRVGRHQLGNTIKYHPSVQTQLSSFLQQDTGISETPISRSMTTLDLSKSGVSDEDIDWIVRRFPNLRSLTAAPYGSDPDKILSSISSLKELRTLLLVGAFTDRGIKHLSNLKNLTSLELRQVDCITDAGLEDLMTLENLTELKLSGGSDEKGISDGIKQSFLQKRSFTTFELNLKARNDIDDFRNISDGLLRHSTHWRFRNSMGR